ncbi:hypothetical protein Tco_0687983 [Tanacetum coccineum]
MVVTISAPTLLYLTQRYALNILIGHKVCGSSANKTIMQGNVMHCTAKGNIVHNFLRLKEGSIYLVKNFTVVPNKDGFRVIRFANFMLEFDGESTVRKSFLKSGGFTRYPFQLVEIDELEPTNNKYLIDVVGYMTNVGRITQTRTCSKTLDFYMASSSGQQIRVTLWGGLGNMLIENRTRHVGLYPVVITSMSVKLYNNRLYLSSTSSTLIVDDEKIHLLTWLKTDDSGVELTKEILSADNTTPKAGTLENLLLWARNRKYDSATFLCEVKIDKVRTKKGWNYPSCGGDKCKKGNLDRMDRYRLELEISNETAEVVVVMSDETARVLLKCSASSILDYEGLKVVTCEDVEEGASSATVAATDASKASEEELEDFDAEASFVADSQPKGGDVACSSDKRKRKRCAGSAFFAGSDILCSQSLGKYEFRWERFHYLYIASNHFCTSIHVFFSVMPPGNNHADRAKRGQPQKAPTQAALSSTGTEVSSYWCSNLPMLRLQCNSIVCHPQGILNGNRDWCHFAYFCERGDAPGNLREQTQAIQRHQHCDTNAAGLGKRIVLPHTFTGSPRAHDRPEVGTRVFKLKPTELLNDLTKNQVFGESHAVVYVIEFQKRGLPHTHVLLWLEEHDKCKTPGDTDDIISAELPSPMDDPAGYKAVTDYMLHEPCRKGVACNVKGKCLKHFPKTFYTETIIDQDGYPIYRQRDNKVCVKKGKFTFDNKYVVPHNRYLLLKYQAHINVEWCNRSKAIKYLFKYLNKGPYRATIVIEENVPNGQGVTPKKVTVVDEIKNYINCRYLAPCEAVWRIFSFDINYAYPFVMKLNFHLSNQHPVTLRDSECLPALLEREGINVTMFTDWFNLNERHPPAKTLTYAEILEHYVWHEQSKILFKYPELQLTAKQIQNYCLVEIQELLKRNGRTLREFQDLPQPNLKLLSNMDNRLIREALAFDMHKSKLEHQQLHSQLNLNNVKTFLYKTNISRLRLEQNIIHVVASLGIASLPLPAGRIAHTSDSKLPVKMKDGEDKPTRIEIPEKFLINSSNSPIEQIIAETYPNFIERQRDDAYQRERAILTPRNDDAEAINAYMFDKLEGESVTYNSANKIFKEFGENPNDVKRGRHGSYTHDHIDIDAVQMALFPQTETVHGQAMLCNDD